MAPRERIPTDEPIQVTVGRIDGKQDLMLANQEVLQASVQRMGIELAAKPCREHAKRISALVRSVDALRMGKPATDGMNLWQRAQQRLGVIMSVLSLVGILGGAWWWSARTYAEVHDKLHLVEEKQARRDKATQKQVKKNLREVLKALKENGNGGH